MATGQNFMVRHVYFAAGIRTYARSLRCMRTGKWHNWHQGLLRDYNASFAKRDAQDPTKATFPRGVRQHFATGFSAHWLIQR